MYETKEMKKQKLLNELEKIRNTGDTEGDHMEADRLLLNYIDDEDIKKEFDKIRKWYA